MGFNFGARQYDRVKETYKKVMTFALIVGALETACLWLFPDLILSVFGSGAGGYEACSIWVIQREFSLLG